MAYSSGKSSKKSSMKESVKSSSPHSSRSPMKESGSVKSSNQRSSTGGRTNETYEISDTELQRVYESALQTEMNVSKGFKDLKEPYVELDGKTPGNSKTPPAPPTGAKHGTTPWEAEAPPHKKDWIPEQVQKMLRAGLAENRSLRESLRKTVAMVETLGKKLHEVNLFNAKVLHVNKILNSGNRLTKEQKTYVMESIDKARSIGEVKMVYETILGAMKTTTTALTEGRSRHAPRAELGVRRTSGTPDPKLLSESVERAQNNDRFGRVRQLAGIVNGRK